MLGLDPRSQQIIDIMAQGAMVIPESSEVEAVVGTTGQQTILVVFHDAGCFFDHFWPSLVFPVLIVDGLTP